MRFEQALLASGYTGDGKQVQSEKPSGPELPPGEDLVDSAAIVEPTLPVQNVDPEKPLLKSKPFGNGSSQRSWCL
ncbi:hypothetical protein CFBP4996_07385 [Agrobacterium leguminum]|uniref:hypothetical protein n=1 Tax=Agrobacterium TaxID=357 RepID=UPI0010C96DF7|nr:MULTISPECIES: hypothetical protein [Agrobacterium]WFS67097.1 hypothetical protein CFBP4996_07385 [Agrobacterium leguminum]